GRQAANGCSRPRAARESQLRESSPKHPNQIQRDQRQRNNRVRGNITGPAQCRPDGRSHDDAESRDPDPTHALDLGQISAAQFGLLGANLSVLPPPPAPHEIGGPAPRIRYSATPAPNPVRTYRRRAALSDVPPPASSPNRAYRGRIVMSSPR